MIYDGTDYNALIRFDENGMKIASYTEIRAAITKRIKEIYGYDIDLSTASLDGQVIEMRSLILNNILNSLRMMYTMLDPKQAYGNMLDIVCSYASVIRKEGTHSSASIAIFNYSNTAITANNIRFVDKNGIEWVWQSSTNKTFAANSTTNLIVTCTEVGPVSATPGSIYTTVENLTFTVTQANAANLGSYPENDDDLRNRRNKSLAISGITSLESLTSALFSLQAIEDVFIYSNNSNVSVTTASLGFNTTNESLPAHSVFVVIRKKANVQISDSTIGTLIYEKMTPGIQTSNATNYSTYRTQKSYNYTSNFPSIVQTVYWYESIPIHPTITITLTALNYYSSDTGKKVGNTIKDYCNAQKLGVVPTNAELIMQAIYADPKFRGYNTYTVTSVAMASTNNLLTYYDYSTVVVTSSGSTITITIN